MPEPTSITFIISRLHVQLKVDLMPNRLVYISPYACTDKNLRLWKGIAQAQTIQAQFTLDGDKKAPAKNVLLSHFIRKGWMVEEMENQSTNPHA